MDPDGPVGIAGLAWKAFGCDVKALTGAQNRQPSGRARRGRVTLENKGARRGMAWSASRTLRSLIGVVFLRGGQIWRFKTQWIEATIWTAFFLF